MFEFERDNFIVVSRQTRFPYSRGLMARSLMRAGIGSEDAYTVARELQEMLLGRGVQEISSAELRPEAASIISARFGPVVADNYKKWKPEAQSIFVGDPGKNEPFSRGIQAQSLLAAGLDPEIAHRVAEKIAVEMSDCGVGLIPRNDLRRFTYRTLLNDFGPQYARQYILWRNLKSPKKPLVLLFSGATGTGKSSLAVEVAHRLGITRVIGTDTIREIMRGMFSTELLPSLYESSYSVWKNWKRPFETHEDRVLLAFQEQAQRVAVGVNAIRRRAVKENLSMIIEGVHLIPEGSQSTAEDRAIEIEVMISTSEEAMHRNRFIERGRQAAERSCKKYLDNFESIRSIQAALVERAGQKGVFIVENIDFDESAHKIVQYLTRRMGELVELDLSAYESGEEATSL